jgi:uncharacterized metal-binding protein YceD (DUF177 family)
VQISVRDILIESVGFGRSYKISGETPPLASVRLTQPVRGEVSITRLEDGLLVRGQLATAVELECHRCLRTFERPAEIRFDQIYAQDPDDDQLPIEAGQIDLAPLIEQEVILGLPIKILCQPDCQGIEIPATKYTNDNGARLGDQARITKGNKRGRT